MELHSRSSRQDLSVNVEKLSVNIITERPRVLSNLHGQKKGVLRRRVKEGDRSKLET